MPSRAHLLSRRHAVDPWYSASRRLPAVPAWSRFSAAGGAAAQGWLYAPGDLEAYRLAVARREAFRDALNVFHPGLFRRFHPAVTFRTQIDLTAGPRRLRVRIDCSGDLHLTCNGRIVLHRRGEGAWTETVDLAPHLVVGANQVVALVNRIDQPPCLRCSGGLATGVAWRCSVDGFRQVDPACFAAGPVPPHEEALPEADLPLRALGEGRFDAGCEVLARPVAVGARPSRVAFSLGESPDEAEDPAHAEQWMEPVAHRAGATTVAPGAFRWLRITPPPAKAHARAVLHPARYAGAFASSDPLLDRIWMASAYTLRLCRQEFLLDGIKRDRLPWVGDLYLSTLVEAFVFGEGPVIRRSLVALAAERPEDCDHNGIIDYSLLWIIAVAAYLRHFGDLAFAREWWPRVELLTAIMERRCDADGWLGDPSAWLFIDWAPMDKGGAVAALQLLHAAALRAAADLAVACGAADRARGLRRRGTAIVDACRRAHWDARRGGYRETLHAGRPAERLSRHAGIVAAAFDLVGPRERAVLGAQLAGTELAPVGTPYQQALECAALARCGRIGDMLGRIRATWGAMLDAGATTFWEAFDPRETGDARYAFYGRPWARSLCHAWSAGPAWLLPQELLGIRPLADGWSRFTVAPRTGGLARVHACVPTPHGEIRVDVEDGRCRVLAPPGAVLARRGAADVSGGRDAVWRL